LHEIEIFDLTHSLLLAVLEEEVGKIENSSHTPAISKKKNLFSIDTQNASASMNEDIESFSRLRAYCVLLFISFFSFASSLEVL
jgi:hypothetical protein